MSRGHVQKHIRVPFYVNNFQVNFCWGEKSEWREKALHTFKFNTNPTFLYNSSHTHAISSSSSSFHFKSSFLSIGPNRDFLCLKSLVYCLLFFSFNYFFLFVRLVCVLGNFIYLGTSKVSIFRCYFHSGFFFPSYLTALDLWFSVVLWLLRILKLWFVLGGWWFGLNFFSVNGRFRWGSL